MGVRRLGALIGGLPLEGAVARSVDPEHLGRGWTTQNELMAVIAELIDQGNRYFFGANSKSGTRQPEPLQVPRPYKRVRPPRKQSTPKQLMAFAGKTGGVIKAKRKRQK